MSVDWTELVRAVGLVMVIEGLLPFAAPSQWRRMLLSVAQFENRALRTIGLLSIAGGLLILNFISS